MPVHKYRRVEDMPHAIVGPPGADGLRLACALCQTAFGLRPWSVPPGVHKHRSLEEATRWRASWTLSRLNSEPRSPEAALLAAFRRAVRAKIEKDILREQADAAARREQTLPAIRRGLALARARGLCGAAWLFGSYAWGEPTAESDVDLLLDGCEDPDGVAVLVGRETCTEVHAVELNHAPQSLVDRARREGLAL